MKKAAIMSLIMFTLLAVPSFSIISPGLSYLSNDQIMSQVLPKGAVDLSAKLEYWSAIEEWAGNTNMVMQGIAANKTSYTILGIPLRASYGLTNDMSVRFTAQVIDRDVVWKGGPPTEFKGYGIGDSKIEMLYLCKK